MKSSLLLFGLLFGLAHGTTVPLKGAMDASIVVDKGGDKRNLPELDGSTLVLGEARCTVKNGRCVLEGVMAGSHIPGAFLTSNAEKVNYKLLEKGDPLVLVKAEPTGMVLLPSKSRELVFHVERFSDDEYAPPKPDPTPTTLAGVQLDNSLEVEVWVRINSAEGGNFERQAEANELKGSILKLGSFTCMVQGSLCVFPKIAPGQYNIEAKITGIDKATYALAPMNPFVVVVDRWTHRPKVKGWDQRPVITIEKTIRSPKKAPSGH